MDFTLVDIIKYLYKWKLLIILSTVVFFIMGSIYAAYKQTYTSRVIIKYKDACVSEGLAPDGSEFDCNEIKSPNVILGVLNDMGYDKMPEEQKKENIETVRGNVYISPVVPEYQILLQEGNLDLGKEYEYNANTFIIEYRGGASQLKTQNILNSIISNYYNYYAEEYLSFAEINEVDYSMNEENFDYIEQLETIQNNVSETVSKLGNYSSESDGYRSTSVGLTFGDINKELKQITEYTIPAIYAKLYEGQVTRDKNLLIYKYRSRKSELLQNAEHSEYLAERTKENMDAYIEANIDVPNSYNNDNDKRGSRVDSSDDSGIVIIDGVEQNGDIRVQNRTTYDTLIKDYESYVNDANADRINAGYCDEVINKFTRDKSADVDYEQCKQFVEDEIDKVLGRLQVLYTNANMVVNDYNTYLITTHLQQLSGIACTSNINGLIYKAGAAFVAVVFSSLFALTFEIVKYYKELEASGEFKKIKQEQKEKFKK